MPPTPSVVSDVIFLLKVRASTFLLSLPRLFPLEDFKELQSVEAPEGSAQEALSLRVFVDDRDLQAVPVRTPPSYNV